MCAMFSGPMAPFKRLIDNCDDNGDGKINYMEFLDLAGFGKGDRSCAASATAAATAASAVAAMAIIESIMLMHVGVFCLYTSGGRGDFNHRTTKAGGAMQVCL